MNFVFKISQKRNQQSSSNFHSTFALMRNGYNNKIKLICGHLGYANEGQRSNLISFSISATVCPIEPNFCMHMECDQTIILHNKIKLICGHLGYANEGQRSNRISFSISATVCTIEPNFCMHMECDQTIILHNKDQVDMRPSWLCKWRSKVKSNFLLYLRNHWSDWVQILYAYWMWSGNHFIK